VQKSKVKQIISNLCSPLKEIDTVKAIFVYGSFVEKGFQKGHDIDLVVIFDDTSEKADIDYNKIKFHIELISKEAKRYGLILHFQPPKPLSLWWKLIRQAEPWVISALRRSIIIYDPTELIKIQKKLLEKGTIYSIDEKAEKLMTRAIENFIEVREKLTRAAWVLLKLMTTANQIILSHLGVFTTSANETKNMLIKYKKELGIKEIFIEWYDELIKINEKIAKGTMSEFKASEIDLWKKRLDIYIRESEDIIIYLDKKIMEEEIKESYNYLLKLLDKALSLKTKKVPKDEKEKIMLFKKYFVNTQEIDKAHYKTLQELYDFVKSKKPIKKVIDKTHIKTLEAAINELIIKK